jgi:hypothetical protein
VSDLSRMNRHSEQSSKHLDTSELVARTTTDMEVSWADASLPWFSTTLNEKDGRAVSFLP